MRCRMHLGRMPRQGREWRCVLHRASLEEWGKTIGVRRRISTVRRSSACLAEGPWCLLHGSPAQARVRRRSPWAATASAASATGRPLPVRVYSRPYAVPPLLPPPRSSASGASPWAFPGAAKALAASATGRPLPHPCASVSIRGSSSSPPFVTLVPPVAIPPHSFVSIRGSPWLGRPGGGACRGPSGTVLSRSRPGPKGRLGACPQPPERSLDEASGWVPHSSRNPFDSRTLRGPGPLSSPKLAAEIEDPCGLSCKQFTEYRTNVRTLVGS